MALVGLLFFGLGFFLGALLVWFCIGKEIEELENKLNSQNTSKENKK